MKTLRRGDKGSEVTYAQQRLMAKGYELPKYGADGDFGGETYEQVVRIQVAHALTGDGIIGPQTWSLLTSEGQAKPPPELTAAEIGAMKTLAAEAVQAEVELKTFDCATGEKVLAVLTWAIEQLDKKEIPDGSNWGEELQPFLESYNDYWKVDTARYGRMAWCGMFALAAIASGLGLKLNPAWGDWKGHPMYNAGSKGGAWLGGVKQIEAWAKDNGCWLESPSRIPAGALFTIGAEGANTDPSAASHVGLNVKDHETVFETIEGNVSNAVKSYDRKRSNLRGAVLWWEVL